MINIVCTSQADHLGRKLRKNSGFKVFFLEKNRDGKRYFPDGELYAKLNSANKIVGRTIILHSGSPKPQDGIVELKMTLDILREAGSKNLEVFFAYFPFGMQDHITDEGETNVAENLVKELVSYYKVKKIYTIDAHFWGRDWLKKYPLVNFSAVDLLKKEVETDYSDLVYLAPDAGSEMRTGIKGAKKKRLNSFTTEYTGNDWLEQKVKNKNVAVVDDLLETGGTMCRFYDECKKYGAKDVVAVITHGVLKKGIRRVKEKYSKLYLSNTIKQKEAKIDACDLITEVLEK